MAFFFLVSSVNRHNLIHVMKYKAIKRLGDPIVIFILTAEIITLRSNTQKLEFPKK